jgi:hypothetical protein
MEAQSEGLPELLHHDIRSAMSHAALGNKRTGRCATRLPQKWLCHKTLDPHVQIEVQLSGSLPSYLPDEANA